MKLNKRQGWIAGTIIAFCGVGIARLLAERMSDGLRPATFIAGIVISFGGLLIIALGTRK